MDTVSSVRGGDARSRPEDVSPGGARGLAAGSTRGSGVWIGLAALFNVGIYLTLGTEAGIEWTTGYLIEKSLSVDNLFVFLLIFSAFSVPTKF